jgi:hypothetical protein
LPDTLIDMTPIMSLKLSSQLPEDVIRLIIEASWPDIMLDEWFARFITLSRVCKVFKRSMYRQRDVLMKAHAMLLHNLENDALLGMWGVTNPFANPYADRKRMFRHLIGVTDESSLRHVGQLLYQVEDWVQENVTRRWSPMIFVTERTGRKVFYSAADSIALDENALIYLLYHVSAATVDGAFEAVYDFALLCYDYDLEDNCVTLVSRSRMPDVEVVRETHVRVIHDGY